MANADQAVARGIRAARLGHGLSLRELARRLDRSPSALSQIENGRIAPSAAMLAAIADELGVDPNDLTSNNAGIPRSPARKPARRTSEPLRADARRNRVTLLEAASVLFADRGLDVSVAEIADRANVTVATLFRHFPTKRHLIEAIGQQRVQAVEQLVSRAVESDDIRAALGSVFENILEMQARDRGLVELIERVLSPELHIELARSWAELLRRAQDAGIVRDDVTAEDIPFLMAGSGGVGRLLSEVRPNLRRRYARLLVDSLRPEGATPLGGKPPSMREVIDAYGTARPDVP